MGKLGLGSLGILLLTFIGQTATASPAAVEFSAETYRKGPQQVENRGRIYVSKERVRTESMQQGQQVIQIMDSRAQKTWVIYPAQRSYLEYPTAAIPSNSMRGGEISPCEDVPASSCQKLGDVKINGRDAAKWSVSITQQDKTASSTQWIDRQRGILLRQEMPGGGLIEQKMVGVERLGNRNVEKWAMQVTQGKGQPQRSYSWFDPELNLVIREEYPGGYLREMRNIRVGAQDARLFTIPAGFKKISPRQPAQDRP